MTLYVSHFIQYHILCTTVKILGSQYLNNLKLILLEA
jgi:hypothetical protein